MPNVYNPPRRVNPKAWSSVGRYLLGSALGARRVVGRDAS
jgi:hypothetical protein